MALSRLMEKPVCQCLAFLSHAALFGHVLDVDGHVALLPLRLGMEGHKALRPNKFMPILGV